MATSPSILVRVLGDLTGLNRAFADAGSKGEKAASSIHSGLSGALAALNTTGVLGPFAQALDGVDQIIETIGDHAKGIGNAFLGIGGATAGVGAALTAIGSKDQSAHQQLQASVEATGKSYDDYETQVEQAIKSQERFGHTANETQDALRVLTQATGDPAKALQLLATASDLAAAKHESLSDAAGQLGKVYNGSTRLLKEFGIQTDKTGDAAKNLQKATDASRTADENLAKAKQHLADLEEIDASKKHLTTAQAIALRNAQQQVTDAAGKAQTAHQKLSAAQDAAKNSANKQGGAVTQLAGKLQGQAAASADTFGGKLDEVKAKIEDTAAVLGQKYGPAITGVGTLLAGLGGAMKILKGLGDIVIGSQKNVKKAVDEVTTATEAQGVMFEKVAGAEVVESSAVADAQAASSAKSAAAVEGQAGRASKALSAVKGFAAAAASAVAAAIAAVGFEVLVVVAVIAALALLGYVIYRNWSTIWAAMKAVVKDVWDWIKNNWPLLVGILTGGLGLAAAWIIQHWRDVLHFFESIPGEIARLAKGMWDGIANAFVDVINFIIHIWNGLQFKIPSVGFGPFRTPGFTLGLPNIPNVPHLDQGGLITATGLVLAHAGEVITPAPASSRMGPAIVFNGDNHFNSEVDIELFLRRAAWTIQTQKI